MPNKTEITTIIHDLKTKLLDSVLFIFFKYLSFYIGLYNISYVTLLSGQRCVTKPRSIDVRLQIIQNRRMHTKVIYYCFEHYDQMQCYTNTCNNK